MRKYTKTVGMVVPTLDNSFFSTLAHFVERTMSRHGICTLTLSSANNAANEREHLKNLVKMGAEGIICASGLSELPEDLLPEDYPLVWIDRVPASERRVPWVANDDADAMEKAAECLIYKGCRHLLLLPGYIAEEQENPRVRGFRRALEKNGLPFDASSVLDRTGTQSSEVETGELIKAAVKNGIPVDGIITSSDRAAFGAMRALQSIIMVPLSRPHPEKLS